MIAFESQGFLEDDANIRRLCALGEVSRAGYYRHFGPHPPAREDADLRDLIQRIALADRHCGYRRVTHTLRRQGLIVNAKRVLRLMREDNLLSLRAKPFVPRTTMSRHGFARCRRSLCWNWPEAISSGLRLSDHAARSMI